MATFREVEDLYFRVNCQGVEDAVFRVIWGQRR